MTSILARIQVRRDTAAAWDAANPVLADGELAYITDTKGEKIGDGVTAFRDLLLRPSSQQLADAVDASAESATLSAQEADASAASATKAEGHEGQANLFRAAAEASAADVASAVVYQNLTALVAEKAITSVDVLVYDTSLDSDGGAWRFRTQGTGYYNEPLNTAIRGSRREPPAVIGIVVEATNITLYDGDDPALPMWMVFPSGSEPGSFLNTTLGRVNTAVAARDGVIAISTSTTNTNGNYGGLSVADLVADTLVRHAAHGASNTTGGQRSGLGVVDRNNVRLPLQNTHPLIVNGFGNDVAITVRPGALIDPATGLPVPTIAVGTDGGVSIIKDNGTVVDLTHTSSTPYTALAFEGDSIAFSTSNGEWRWVEKIPDADVVLSGNWYTKGTADEGYNTYFKDIDTDTLQLARKWKINLAAGDYLAGNKGLISLAKNKSNHLLSLFANTTSLYTTGWMFGDVRGAFLSDTDTTDLVEATAEVSTNLGNPFTDLTGITPIGGILTLVDGKVVFEANSTFDYLQIDVPTIKGYRYTIAITGFRSASAMGLVRLSTNWFEQQVDGYLDETSGDLVLSGIANETRNSPVLVYANQNTFLGGEVINIERFSVTERATDTDRSKFKNSLDIHGVVPRSPVAVGSELAAYGPFSGVDYQSQPYNSGFDFGTGDFYFMGWAKIATAELNTNPWVERSDGTLTGKFLAQGLLDGSIQFVTNNTALVFAGPHPTNQWFLAAFVREAGVKKVFINGKLVADDAGAAASHDMTSASGTHVTRFGLTNKNQRGKMSLWRIGAGAPSPSQMAKIYRDELPLFQPGAACTLYGTSDAVTALAHDDVTGLLHAGTSAGRSVFSGLKRVSNTADPVGTAISAVNNFVLEE